MFQWRQKIWNNSTRQSLDDITRSKLVKLSLNVGDQPDS